jgi:hypothetical protein
MEVNGRRNWSSRRSGAPDLELPIQVLREGARGIARNGCSGASRGMARIGGGNPPRKRSLVISWASPRDNAAREFQTQKMDRDHFVFQPNGSQIDQGLRFYTDFCTLPLQQWISES